METMDAIFKTKKINDLNNVLWKPYEEHKVKSTLSKSTGIKILILNAPCNGFGDLIFAVKLKKYLIQWYGAEVTLATTYEKGLLDLGEDPKYVVGLEGGKSSQCIRFASLSMNRPIPKQDLILVAPIQMDLKPSLPDVQKLIPYAYRWNTFYFSEYNDTLDKNFTFNTGIGKDRDGILLTNTTKSIVKPKGLKNPYSIIYVAQSITGVEKCIVSFVEMICTKYHKKYKNMDIVVPPWFADENMDKKITSKVSKYYPNIKIIDSDKADWIIHSDGNMNDNTLTFRCDILPVPNKIMIQLMINSVDDILLTGDQSITDALSCCDNKNIFYQIAPWKNDLAKNLAKHMPNINLKKISTSCGSLNAIKYKSSYKNFVNTWDFRKRARGKLDAIVLSILAIKTNVDISNIADVIAHITTLSDVKRELKNMDVYKKPKRSVHRKSSVPKRSVPKRSVPKRSVPKRSVRRKSSVPKRSVRMSKKCLHGVKVNGDCKKKSGPKKEVYRRKSSKKCLYGVKVNGDCKKKSGPKRR
jgi:hypothetical protein